MKYTLLAVLVACLIGTPARAEESGFWSFFRPSTQAPTQESKGHPTPVHAMVTEVAQAHGINPAIAHAIVKVESRYNCKAKNGPSTGIMQVNARTARGVGVTGNLMDCRTGLEAGMRYLKQAINAYGATCAGLSAYNTGIYKTGRCTGYGRKVLALSKR